MRRAVASAAGVVLALALLPAGMSYAAPERERWHTRVFAKVAG